MRSSRRAGRGSCEPQRPDKSERKGVNTIGHGNLLQVAGPAIRKQACRHCFHLAARRQNR
jgi:hypothetical protein